MLRHKAAGRSESVPRNFAGVRTTPGRFPDKDPLKPRPGSPQTRSRCLWEGSVQQEISGTKVRIALRTRRPPLPATDSPSNTAVGKPAIEELTRSRIAAFFGISRMAARRPSSCRGSSPGTNAPCLVPGAALGIDADFRSKTGKAGGIRNWLSFRPPGAFFAPIFRRRPSNARAKSSPGKKAGDHSAASLSTIENSLFRSRAGARVDRCGCRRGLGEEQP